MREIPLKDAKATLSAVVDQAVAGKPAVITRHGRKQAVILSFEDYERLSRVPSFGQLLAAFPSDVDDIPSRPRKPCCADGGKRSSTSAEKECFPSTCMPHAAGLLLDRARAHRPGFEDMVIAATAEVHGLTILTDNEPHFARLGCRRLIR